MLTGEQEFAALLSFVWAAYLNAFASALCFFSGPSLRISSYLITDQEMPLSSLSVEIPTDMP